jgi:hypothetical protein
MELACLSGPLVIHANGFYFTYFGAHLNTIFGASWKKVMGGWKKLQTEDHHNIFHKIYSDDKIYISLYV